MQLYQQPSRQAYSPTIIPDDVPVYRVGEGKFFASDKLFEEGTIISWDGEPNLEMQPLNGKARESFSAFLNKYDDLGRKAAKAAGKAYVSRKDAFDNQYALARQDGRRVNVLNAPKEIPLMGGKRNVELKAQELDITPSNEVPIQEVGPVTEKLEL